MRTKLLTLFLLAFSLTSSAKIDSCPADMVNPLMGTLSYIGLSTGNTYPAIALPWGMNFWMPQTGQMGHGWAYVYSDDRLRDFKQTHQPSPWINDYGQFAFIPETGVPEFHQDKRASHFSHKAEEAHPYYYKVYLADYDVTTEIVPTDRAALLRLTYPATDEASFILDALDDGSYVKIIPEEQMVVGYTTKNSDGVPENFKNYFVLRFDHPFSSVNTVDVKATGNDRAKDDYGSITISNDLELSANHVGAIIKFAPMARGEQVMVSIASSFISPEQAEQNLSELGDGDFEALKQSAKDRWNEVLGAIEVDDKSDIDHLRTFYSCLYRAVLFPRSFYELTSEGEVMHYSPYNGEVLPGYMFTDTGFWDTFRCLFPLLNLVYPSMNLKMQEGLVNAYLESGFLPEWASPGHRGCMVGNNSASIVADAYLKGQKVKEPELLWEAVVHGANDVHPYVSSTGRCGYEYYNKLGYIPYDVMDKDGHINESVARTLEYAYDDWCIYQFGKALGKSEKELAQYKEHALNYRNVFDKETLLMRGRNVDGTFQEPFSPLKWGDAFTEGNAWHYTWSVFHDPQGLIDLMGGKQVFTAMLDSVFNVPPLFDESYYGGVIHEIREMQIMNMGNYAHGNQPIQHMIYLYDWGAEPWKTQYWVRQAMDRLYSATPDGYCGDEDNGQTSAWYVFSAMGFYPVCPGSGEYAIGAPYFKTMRLHLENGNTVEIVAEDKSLQASAEDAEHQLCRAQLTLCKSLQASAEDAEHQLCRAQLTLCNSENNYYVQALTVNGEPYDKNYFTHEQLLRGGRYVYQMSSTPNTSRGVADEDAPYSFSTR